MRVSELWLVLSSTLMMRSAERSVNSRKQARSGIALVSHLAGHVKDDVVAFEFAKAVDEPVDVLLKILHDVEHRAIGTKPLLAHDILERDQVGNVECARVRERVIGWIEIDDLNRTSPGCQELVEAGTVSALARACR